MQNLRSERPPRGLAISRKAWKREGPIRLPCKHPRLSGMDPPCPIRCVPAPWVAYDKAQRPALCANVGPDIDKADGAQPFRQRVRRIRPHPVHYGAPPGIPGLLVHDQKHAGRSEYAEHLGKGGGYIRPKVDRLESGDEIEGRIGIGQPGNIPLPHFAVPGGDGSGVLPEAGGDALSGKIDPADRPLRAEFQKLRQIRPAAASYIEHPGVWLRRHMRPTPLRQRSVPPVHSPQHDPPG